MKKVILSILTLNTLNSFAQQNEAVNQKIPYQEVTHEDVPGYILFLSGDTLKGLISYSEYGKESIWINCGTDSEGKYKINHYKTCDSIGLMFIENRGTFISRDFSGSGKRELALIADYNNAYIEYKKFQTTSVASLLITGGSIEGRYEYYLLNKKTSVLYKYGTIKSMKKNVDEYIDYCPEVTEKVKNEEKGYKQSLLQNSYMLLKKIILESYTTCVESK